MGILVLLVVGVIIWLAFTSNDTKATQKRKNTQSKEDKEFEEMFFSGASGEDIDDF